MRRFIREHGIKIVSLSPLFFPMTPSLLIAPRRPRFNEAISFAGTPIQNKCVVLINTGCLICNSAAKPCLLYLHRAWSCHRDLAVPPPPVSGIHPSGGPISPPTCVISFRDCVWILMSDLPVTPTRTAPTPVNGRAEKAKKKSVFSAPILGETWGGRCWLMAFKRLKHLHV